MNFTWDHGVRINHILTISSSDMMGRWGRGKWKAGETLTVTKTGRRVFVDGPLLFCDEEWTMLGYVKVLSQTMRLSGANEWKTEVHIEVVTVFDKRTSAILSRENARAQRAAGNPTAAWPPPPK